jgi:hypothetical protein
MEVGAPDMGIADGRGQKAFSNRRTGPRPHTGFSFLQAAQGKLTASILNNGLLPVASSAPVLQNGSRLNGVVRHYKAGFSA